MKHNFLHVLYFESLSKIYSVLCQKKQQHFTVAYTMNEPTEALLDQSVEMNQRKFSLFQTKTKSGPQYH